MQARDLHHQTGVSNSSAYSKATVVVLLLAVRSLTVLHCRFEAMMHVMQKGMPDTQIIIQAIYPRGADFAANSFQWPNHFTYPIDLLNALYQARRACKILAWLLVSTDVNKTTSS